MLHIVTDSATDMPADWLQRYNIRVIPVNIHFGERTFLQGIDLDTEGFYRLVDKSGLIPKTSQPSPHQFQTFYERIARPGDTILSIHVTSKLSGTYQSALAAAAALKEKFRIIPFDSLAGSAAVGWMCREARQLAAANQPLDAILQRLETMRKRLRIFFALDTLEYARRSGRVNALQAALVSALRVKPLVHLQNGELVMFEKIRTRAASLRRILQLGHEALGNQPVYLSVVHARDPETGQQILKKAQQMFNVAESNLVDLSISVAANLGPGTIGIVLYPVSGESYD